MGCNRGTLTEHPQRQTISFSELVDTAFSQIAQNIERAVSTLVGLLDATDDRLKRLAANGRNRAFPQAPGAGRVRGTDCGH